MTMLAIWFFFSAFLFSMVQHGLDNPDARWYKNAFTGVFVAIFMPLLFLGCTIYVLFKKVR